MAPSVRSQNLSIMLTDIQGYSNTAATATREEIIDLIRRHNNLMRPVIEFYGGTVIKSIGDAFLCTFPSATDAVICAIIIQLLLKDYNQRLEHESQHLNLRVVINSGDVSIEGNDIFGNAVNITARMEGLECFPGGTIGISESTWLMMDRTEIFAEKIGPQTLKGVPEPVNVFKVPLEGQKIKELPDQLVQIVEKVINPTSTAIDGAAAKKQLEEWKTNIGTFLQKTNWGENIGKASQKIGQIQTSIANTLAKQNVPEKQGGSDAPNAKRLKAFGIDFALILAIVFISGLVWWPVQRVVFGPSYIMEDSDTVIDFENYIPGKKGDEMIYIRKKSFIEKAISLNIYFPVIPIWIYLLFFWRLKKASIGQIMTNVSIVHNDGKELDWVLCAKRSALFVFSCLTLFGVLMIFAKDKLTLYDKLCETKVVE
jgi:class 3 adenylate cyclase/uncharacterized RDD family membrane protein YckC